MVLPCQVTMNLGGDDSKACPSSLTEETSSMFENSRILRSDYS